MWTSAETVVVSHGDTDAVSVGDFHHKNEVAWHLTGRPRGTDEEMVKLLEEFDPIERGSCDSWPPSATPPPSAHACRSDPSPRSRNLNAGSGRIRTK